jgi:SOS response regulatory protein OraA/RecX
LRELERIGIDRTLAREAVAEVFEGVDETELMRRALASRSSRRSHATHDRSEYRRLFAYLVRKGFDPPAVHSLLRRRVPGGVPSDEEETSKDE